MQAPLWRAVRTDQTRTQTRVGQRAGADAPVSGARSCCGSRVNCGDGQPYTLDITGMRELPKALGALSRILLWTLVLCVCGAGLPRAATPWSWRAKQTHAAADQQKSSPHKWKSGRFSEPQKWSLWSPGPGDFRPIPVVVGSPELPTPLYAILLPSAFPARAPPAFSIQV
jgi:hypothetical protein